MYRVYKQTLWRWPFRCNNYCILLCAVYKLGDRERERESLKHSKNYCILLCAPSNKTQTKLNYKGIKTTATNSAVILRWAKWVWPLGVHISVCVSVTGQQANSRAIYKCETKATLCKKRKVANEALSQSQ